MALLMIPCYPLTPSSNHSEFSLLNNGRGLLSLAGKPIVPRHVQRKTSYNSVPLPYNNIKSSNIKDSEIKPAIDGLHVSKFPYGFIFGAASAAYQVEGGSEDKLRGRTIWDTFAKQDGAIKDGSNGDIACDSYNKYKEDIKLLKDANMDAYRFSISWPRILPKGSKDEINEDGIKYYNDLINECIKNGIKPFVTLFHWDVPQALEDAYGGFRDPRIQTDFKDYCEVCFEKFGDRVKHWITLNEPWIFSSRGYASGEFAPGRSSTKGPGSEGDSKAEPYIVGHNLILAHASAVKCYKEKFQDKQGGKVGITVVAHWIKPISDSNWDAQAAGRELDFTYGWYMDPLVHGDYPFSMKSLLRDRLPSFTTKESEMIKGSYDFIGINYYTARYAKSLPISLKYAPKSYTEDSYSELTVMDSEGNPIGPQEPGPDWIYRYPEGIKDLLVYTKKKLQ